MRAGTFEKDMSSYKWSVLYLISFNIYAYVRAYRFVQFLDGPMLILKLIRRRDSTLWAVHIVVNDGCHILREVSAMHYLVLLFT